MSQEKFDKTMVALRCEVGANHGMPKIFICGSDSAQSLAVGVALMAQGVKLSGLVNTHIDAVRCRLEDLDRYQMAAIRALDEMASLVQAVPLPYNPDTNQAKRNWRNPRKALRRARARWARRRGSRARRKRA